MGSGVGEHPSPMGPVLIPSSLVQPACDAVPKASWCFTVGLLTPAGRFLLVTEIVSDVTESPELFLLLNSDYSQLTADFFRKAPTSGPRKSCSVRVSWQGSSGEGGESSGSLTILSS